MGCTNFSEAWETKCVQTEVSNICLTFEAINLYYPIHLFELSCAWNSGGSSQPDNQIQEVALTVEKKEIAAVQPPEDRASMIQAARERFLARKGQK